MYSTNRQKDNAMYESFSQQGSEIQLKDSEVSSLFIESHKITITTTDAVYNHRTLQSEFSQLYEQDPDKFGVVAIIAARGRTHHALGEPMKEMFRLDQRRDGKLWLGSLSIRTWDVTIQNRNILVFEQLGLKPSELQRQVPRFNPYNARGLSIMTDVVTATLRCWKSKHPSEEDTNDEALERPKYTHNYTAYRAPSPTPSEKERAYLEGWRSLFPPLFENPDDGIWQVDPRPNAPPPRQERVLR